MALYDYPNDDDKARPAAQAEDLFADPVKKEDKNIFAQPEKDDKNIFADAKKNPTVKGHVPIEEAHSRPVMVERNYGPEARPAAGSAREFVVVLDNQGLKQLMEDGHLSKEQYQDVEKKIPSNGVNQRYVITFEGTNAGDLKATRAFMADLVPEPSGSEHQSIRLTETLNLSVKNPMAQSMLNNDSPYETKLMLEGEKWLPSRSSVNEMFQELKGMKLAQQAPRDPNMQRALAQASDKNHAPEKGYDGVSSTVVPSIIKRGSGMEV